MLKYLAVALIGLFVVAVLTPFGSEVIVDSSILRILAMTGAFLAIVMIAAFPVVFLRFFRS